ncbi:MAG: biotin/lipoyl-containing protein, partial [Burkholderiales bacterium]
MATIELKVPDIGDFADVEVIELLVSPGDAVKAEQSLLTVESDKASMEIPSSAAGRIVEMRVKLGDKVSKGTVIALLEAAEAGASAPAPAPAAAPAPTPAAAPPRATALAPAPPGAALAPAASSAGPVLVEVPDIGDFKDVEVIELLVKPGDTVKAEQSLVTVESDKASMEIPSSVAGVVVELKVKVGDKVSKGAPLAVVAAQPTGAAPRAGDGPVESSDSPAEGRPSGTRDAMAAARQAEATPAAGAPLRTPPVPAGGVGAAGGGVRPHAARA